MSEAPAMFQSIACALCGHRFDAYAGLACASCPLGKGCSIACCPNCGYGAPIPGRAALWRLTARVAAAISRRRAPTASAPTLSEAAPGSRVTIAAIDRVPVQQREQLLAHGIAPGRVVDVVQIRPVLVVRVEHADVAFETRLGRAISTATAEEAA